MKKFIICVLLILTLTLSGCVDVSLIDTAPIHPFDRIETENFILIYITTYNEDMIIQLIQDEFENGNTYIDSISPDIVAGGRSVTMLLFGKGE